MMNNVEMIEAVMAKANVSYETAKEILEGVNYDMDAAEAALIKEGYIKNEDIKEEKTMTNMNTEKNTNGKKVWEAFKDGVKNIAEWCGDLFCKGMKNNFCVDTENGKHFEIPVSILAILLLAGCGIVPLLLLIAFFTGCRFSFIGDELGTEKVNDTMEKVRFTASN